jgi:hypothetical protein
MKTTAITAAFALVLAIPFYGQEQKFFRESQWKYPRVRTASNEKDEVLRQRFKDKNLAYPPRAILLRAFKQEAMLELWATGGEDRPYILVHK